MTSLHTINKAPARGLLQQCLKVATSGDGILFIEDGVCHCLQTRDALQVPPDIACYVLREDLLARGLLDHNRAQLELTSYRGFVELCCRFDKTLNWS